MAYLEIMNSIVITSEVERDLNLDSPHKGEKVMSLTKLQGC